MGYVYLVKGGDLHKIGSCGKPPTEYDDDPGAWGEDCPSEENHLVTCSGCKGSGLRKDCDVQ